MNNDRDKGLYNKFTIIRNDGQSEPEMKHHNCDYFVLDITHDKFAKNALIAYALACEGEYPQLARDIRSKFNGSNSQ